ncbi:M20 family metallopeptidase [[Eubacterium] cellulosolvens]
MEIRVEVVDSDEKKVIECIDAHSDEIVEFIRELIKFKTYNPEKPGNQVYETKECQEFIMKKLHDMQMETELYEPDVESLEKKYRGTLNYIPNRAFCLKDRPQLWSRLRGTGGGKSMLLLGHIDTVPAEPLDAWTHNPFGGEVEDGKIYGRGAADMKGGVGMMIKALDFIQQAGVKLKGDVQVWTVNDEEVGLMGTFSLADKFLVEKKLHVDAVMDPECTGLEVVTALRGIMFGKMTIKGVTGHAEGVRQPHWTQGGAVSAIHKAFKIFSAIEELNKEWSLHPRKQHPLYQCWRTVPPTCMVTMIHGGSAPNVYAGDCTLTYDIQHNANEKGDDVIKEFEAYISQVCQADSWLKNHPPKPEWGISVVPFETPSDHPLVTTLLEANSIIGYESSIIGAPWYCDAGPVVLKTRSPAVIFGPGSTAFAHKPNECLSIEDLIKCCKIYALTLMRWCKKS